MTTFKKRTIITHTPNYMVVPPKVVYDSSKKKDQKKDWRKVYIKYHETGEDSEVRVFYAYPMISDAEILKTLSCAMEISSPASMFWNDVGVIARRTIRKLRKGCRCGCGNADTNIAELLEEYDAKIEGSSKVCGYPLNKRNREYL